MKKPLLYTNLILLALVCLSFSWQENFYAKVPKEVLVATQKMRFIESGSFNMGYVDGSYARTKHDSMLLLSNMARRVTVASFYMSSEEVTNAEWLAFYNAKVKELGEAKSAAFYPDTLVWTRDFAYSYNDPMVNYYFKHPAYQNYPVVGVSWDMAQEYCRWYSEYINGFLKEAGMEVLPDFRLPSEAEWEYAALGVVNKDPEKISPRIFPWNGNKLVDSKNQYLANFGTIRDANGFEHKSYLEDNTVYTSSVKTYTPNDFGLYNMAGNVSEWVQDVARPVYVLNNDDINPLRRNTDGKNLYNDAKPLNDSLRIAQKILQYHTSIGRDTSNAKDRAMIDVAIKTAWQDVQISKNKNGVETRVVKGGSWADPAIYMLCGSRQAVLQNKTSSMIGFRMGMTRVGLLDSSEPKNIQDLLIKRPKTTK